jgi:hypothetical protein
MRLVTLHWKLIMVGYSHCSRYARCRCRHKGCSLLTPRPSCRARTSGFGSNGRKTGFRLGESLFASMVAGLTQVRP